MYKNEPNVSWGKAQNVRFLQKSSVIKLVLNDNIECKYPMKLTDETFSEATQKCLLYWFRANIVLTLQIIFYER